MKDIAAFIEHMAWCLTHIDQTSFGDLVVLCFMIGTPICFIVTFFDYFRKKTKKVKVEKNGQTN